MLSIHNIGQRLFAKYVLGLSQGTVSELLSKPKSWDKLTEKGRDSYRKMHAWVWDEGAILLLKTLIPRKGELLRSSSSSAAKAAESGAAAAAEEARERQLSQLSSEHRINKILSEVKPELPPQLPASLLLPSLPAPPSQAASEELKLAALSFYQSELGSQLAKDQDQDTEDSDKEEAREERDREEREETFKPSPFSLLQAKADHSFGLVRPSLPSGPGPLFPGFVHSLENPLQRMASITNSLVSQPLPSPQFSQKPLKAVLPPITQQQVTNVCTFTTLQPRRCHPRLQSLTSDLFQFDQYAHLNTDDLTRRTKELLSQYSISQRLFGEAVLGLSQGSVSDLLARPKPWHMLTQKGREPFIRMKIFLEDETAVHRLVASQYKIAPDKLMRTGNFNHHMGEFSSSVNT